MYSFCDWLAEEKNYLIIESNDIGEFFSKCADAIAGIANKRTVVILGRDAWPLVPLLRHRNIKTQYFLYSRLQIGDESTKLAWLTEVPRNSLVIDTGYAGSIIDDIRTFDPSAKGILLSSTGKYPELEVPYRISRRDIVDRIEHVPKLVDRAVGFKYHNALIKPIERDSDVGWRGKAAEVIKRNEELLRSTGLPEDLVQKYKSFTGITPKQRLGHTDFVSHLMKVQKSRERKEKEEKNWHEKWDHVVRLAISNRPFEWNWSEIPEEVAYHFRDKAVRLYRDVMNKFIRSKIYLDKIPSWDVEYLKEAEERLKRRKLRLANVWKLVEPVYRNYYYP